LDRLVYQGLRIFLPEFMSHDEAIEQAFDGGEEGPALLGGDEGDIRDPFLIRLCSGEVTVEHILIPMVSSQFVYFLAGFAFSDDGMQIELVHQPQNSLMINCFALGFADPPSNSSIPVGST